MAIFVLKMNTVKDAGALQGTTATPGTLKNAMNALGMSTSLALGLALTYQADIDVDSVFIDPALNLTKLQLKQMGLTKFGNGVTTCALPTGQLCWFFVVPEAIFNTVLTNIGNFTALT